MCNSAKSFGLLSLVLVVTLAARPASADEPKDVRLPPSLMTTLDALGATSGVPDGIGYSFSPSRPVTGQAADILLQSTQLGASVPVWQTPADAFFVNASVKAVTLGTNAILPDDRKPIPNRFWDVLLGGTYIRQLDNGNSVGLSLSFGSASDRPFESRRDATLSALAFYRIPNEDRDAWLLYLVSQTNGQIGHNIPIPGLAYEFERDFLHGIVGFPFISLTFTPFERTELAFFFAPLTDIRATASYAITDRWKAMTGFVWDNQSWFWSGRRRFRDDLLFLYEKRVESSLQYNVTKQVNISIKGGYAFDRFFVENRGFGLHGRNRIEFGSGPYTAIQANITY